MGCIIWCEYEFCVEGCLFVGFGVGEFYFFIFLKVLGVVYVVFDVGLIWYMVVVGLLDLCF